jgi:hypothetical protein
LDSSKLREIEIESKHKKGEKPKNIVTKITDKIYKYRRTTGGFGPPFPLQKHMFIAQFWNLWTSLKKPKKREKMKEVREMGAPPSYLTGLDILSPTRKATAACR